MDQSKLPATKQSMDQSKLPATKQSMDRPRLSATDQSVDEPNQSVDEPRLSAANESMVESVGHAIWAFSGELISPAGDRRHEKHFHVRLMSFQKNASDFHFHGMLIA